MLLLLLWYYVNVLIALLFHFYNQFSYAILSSFQVLECDHSNDMAAKFAVLVLFIMLYKVVLTFDCVNKIAKCDHSNESY